MRRVLLIHLNAGEASDRARGLRGAGFHVAIVIPQGLRFLADVRRDPPDAIVIDIERLPSVGRDIGLALRMSKATRHLPMLFAGGAPEKVTAIRKLLPDASYARWSKVGAELRRAIVRRIANPVVPRSIFETYSSTPLAKKLGIKENSSFALVGAPDGFSDSLGRLPDGATMRESARGCAIALWFVRSSKELNRGIDKIAAQIEDGSIWIAWPKKSSPMACDLSQVYVRRAGLAIGLVDFKVCAIDATWSGLLFKRRKSLSAKKGRRQVTPPALIEIV
jgi:hypothetical protein